MKERTVLDAGDISRSLKRISYEIAERNESLEDVVLLGIPTRGAVLAERLGQLLAQIDSSFVPAERVGTIDITMYRDDLRKVTSKPVRASTPPTRGIDNQIVILVDDVLFSGRTVRAALDALNAFGRAHRIQLAVLVDRGHRDLPIRADYVGKNLPTARSERVFVNLSEHDETDVVQIQTGPTV